MSSIKIAQALLWASTIIWMVFSIWYYARFSTASSQTSTMLVVAFLMFVNAVIFLAIGWGIGKRLKFVFYFALLFLIGHIILTITDEFGIFDTIVLLIDLAILAILVFNNNLFSRKTL